MSDMIPSLSYHDRWECSFKPKHITQYYHSTTMATAYYPY